MKAKHRSALQKSISRSLQQTRAEYDHAVNTQPVNKKPFRTWTFLTLVAIATTLAAGGFYYVG